MMTNFDPELIAAARLMIVKNFGSLSDMPDEMRNTIVNIYYDYCGLARHVLSGRLAPPDVESKGWERATDEMMKNWAFLQSSVESLPGYIESFRKLPPALRSSGSVYVFFFLAQFKYRFMDENPFLGWMKLKVMLKRHFSPPKEIPDLWKVIEVTVQ